MEHTCQESKAPGASITPSSAGRDHLSEEPTPVHVLVSMVKLTLTTCAAGNALRSPWGIQTIEVEIEAPVTIRRAGLVSLQTKGPFSGHLN